jgi:hypothetical protein
LNGKWLSCLIRIKLFLEFPFGMSFCSTQAPQPIHTWDLAGYPSTNEGQPSAGIMTAAGDTAERKSHPFLQLGKYLDLTACFPQSNAG